MAELVPAPNKSCVVCYTREQVMMEMDGRFYMCTCPAHRDVPPAYITHARHQFLTDGKTQWDR